MDAYLVDGTYELFRHFYAIPPQTNSAGEEVAATRGVLGSVISMLETGTTHIGVATDHVIESFRNDLWPGYKTSEGVDPRLLAQFQLLEDALESLGVIVWPMVELEADDALAGAAEHLAKFPKVRRVFICSPDKDLAQCVRKKRVLMFDRRRDLILDEKGVVAKFGVQPGSIPDYLGLVGDTADGYPGLDGWGEKSASVVLSRYKHIEKIPKSELEWEVRPRGADKLAATLRDNFKLAMLFRDLATLRKTEPRIKGPDEIRWNGPSNSFVTMFARLEASQLQNRVVELAKSRHASVE
jgi:5'-3' exonuclease